MQATDSEFSKENQFTNGFISNKLLMVRPTNFAFNTEATDNEFMNNETNSETNLSAQKEFDNFVDLLRNKDSKLQVVVYEQHDPRAVDSVYPNNWFCTIKNKNIPEGAFFLFPMKMKVRRIERNPKIIEELKVNYKHFIDLTYLEDEEEFLESTGCLIFDHLFTKVYVNMSERATDKALNIFMDELNKISQKPYKAVTFNAYGKDGIQKIYHTNVMMSVLEKHVVVCLESIKNDDERQKVKNEAIEGRDIIDISYDEVYSFGGNVINLKTSADAKAILVCSRAALESYRAEIRQTLESEYDLVTPDLTVIEKIGGGSARCMIGEIYDNFDSLSN